MIFYYDNYKGASINVCFKQKIYISNRKNTLALRHRKKMKDYSNNIESFSVADANCDGKCHSKKSRNFTPRSVQTEQKSECQTANNFAPRTVQTTFKKVDQCTRLDHSLSKQTGSNRNATKNEFDRVSLHC